MPKGVIMKSSLILAAILSLVAAPALAQKHTPQTIAHTVSLHEQACVGWITNKLSTEQVVSALGLDNEDKKADFVVHCLILKNAFEAGQSSGYRASTEK